MEDNLIYLAIYVGPILLYTIGTFIHELKEGFYWSDYFNSLVECAPLLAYPYTLMMLYQIYHNYDTHPIEKIATMAFLCIWLLITWWYRSDKNSAYEKLERYKKSKDTATEHINEQIEKTKRDIEWYKGEINNLTNDLPNEDFIDYEHPSPYDIRIINNKNKIEEYKENVHKLEGELSAYSKTLYEIERINDNSKAMGWHSN